MLNTNVSYLILMLSIHFSKHFNFISLKYTCMQFVFESNFMLINCYLIRIPLNASQHIMHSLSSLPILQTMKRLKKRSPFVRFHAYHFMTWSSITLFSTALMMLRIRLLPCLQWQTTDGCPQDFENWLCKLPFQQ